MNEGETVPELMEMKVEPTTPNFSSDLQPIISESPYIQELRAIKAEKIYKPKPATMVSTKNPIPSKTTSNWNKTMTSQPQSECNESNMLLPANSTCSNPAQVANHPLMTHNMGTIWLSVPVPVYISVDYTSHSQFSPSGLSTKHAVNTSPLPGVPQLDPAIYPPYGGRQECFQSKQTDCQNDGFYPQPPLPPLPEEKPIVPPLPQEQKLPHSATSDLALSPFRPSLIANPLENESKVPPKPEIASSKNSTIEHTPVQSTSHQEKCVPNALESQKAYNVQSDQTQTFSKPVPIFDSIRASDMPLSTLEKQQRSPTMSIQAPANPEHTLKSAETCTGKLTDKTSSNSTKVIPSETTSLNCSPVQPDMEIDDTECGEPKQPIRFISSTSPVSITVESSPPKLNEGRPLTWDDMVIGFNPLSNIDSGATWYKSVKTTCIPNKKLKQPSRVDNSKLPKITKSSQRQTTPTDKRKLETDKSSPTKPKKLIRRSDPNLKNQQTVYKTEPGKQEPETKQKRSRSERPQRTDQRDRSSKDNKRLTHPTAINCRPVSLFSLSPMSTFSSAQIQNFLSMTRQYNDKPNFNT